MITEYVEFTIDDLYKCLVQEFANHISLTFDFYCYDIIVTLMYMRTALMSLSADLEKWALKFSINEVSCSRRGGGVHHCSDFSCTDVKRRKR